MAEWLEPQPIVVPPALREAVGGHRLVSETMARRGILAPNAAHAFLDPSAYLPASPADLPDMSYAVQHLRRADAAHLSTTGATGQTR